MTVRDVMTPDPKTLPPYASVERAAKLMREYDIGAIPIIDNMGSLVGIITDRDITVRFVAAGLSSNTPIEDVMTRNPESVPADTTIEHAIHVLSVHKIRRLPVVEYSKVIGIVSLVDIARSTIAAGERAESLVCVSEGGLDRGYADVRAISQY